MTVRTKVEVIRREYFVLRSTALRYDRPRRVVRESVQAATTEGIGWDTTEWPGAWRSVRWR